MMKCFHTMNTLVMIIITLMIKMIFNIYERENNSYDITTNYNDDGKNSP